jgi:hypothetical protein
MAQNAMTIVRGVNIEDLYIDSPFANINELKLMVHSKYGIPVESQRVVCYGGNYSICLSAEPDMEGRSFTNPLCEFGVPDERYFPAEAAPEEMKRRLLPCAGGPKAPETEVVGVGKVLKHILSSKYDDAGKELTGREKQLILRDPKRYVDAIFSELKVLLDID